MPRSMVIGGARAEVFADKASLAIAAAERFVAVAAQCIETHGAFRVALAGGSTPAELYRRLTDARTVGRVDWRRVHVFFGDERNVAPIHPDSNYRMAHECLLRPAAIPDANVHRIEAERPAPEAADAYAEVLQESFAPGEGAWPRFDLILLGLGEDGHTASLFPGTTALDDTERLVVANAVPKLGTTRITLTPPVLNAAARVWFVVTGASKAAAAKRVLGGDRDPRQFPAQLVAPEDGELRWWLDESAASDLG